MKHLERFRLKSTSHNSELSRVNNITGGKCHLTQKSAGPNGSEDHYDDSDKGSGTVDSYGGGDCSVTGEGQDVILSVAATYDEIFTSGN